MPIDSPDGRDIELFKLMEERRMESQRQYELLHERISNMKDEINTDIQNSHKIIMAEIKDLRGEQRRHSVEMSNRLTNLEKWKWTAGGILIALTFAMTALQTFGALQ